MVEVTRLAISGQAVRFERATLVHFVGWRLLVVGGALDHLPQGADVPVEVTFGGNCFGGTARVVPPQRGTAGRRLTTLLGVGTLQYTGVGSSRR